MPDIMIRDYWAGDAALIRERPEQAGEFGLGANDFDAFAVPQGQSWTLVRDGVPMLSGGICPIWDNRRYIAWVVAGNLTMREWGRVVRKARAVLDAHDAPRIEADCRSDFKAGRTFLEGLGFLFEGAMTRYDGEADYYRYARPGAAFHRNREVAA